MRYCLKTVEIDEGVTSIGGNAFSDCSLESITIPDSVTSIGDFAFSDCTSLTSVSFADNSQLTSIGYGAFQNCTNLKNITIPKSVTSIGERAFNHCTSLTSIEVDEDNAAFCSIDGVLFNKEKTSLLNYPINKSGVSYTIPDSVISIEYLAFADCANLESIVIPNGVASIGIDAFCNTKLTSIVIPKSVKSIGNYAFQRNGKLESVTFEENSELTSIPEYAFDRCSSLKSINIPSSVASIEKLAFRMTGLTSITIPASVTSIGNYAFYDCRSLTSIFLPDGLDVTNADIPDVATQVRYTVVDDGVYLIKDVNLNGQSSVNFPDTIGGKTVTAVCIKDGTTGVVIPETATQVKYTVADNKVTITEIALGTDRTSVDIPETIGGYTVAAVAAEHQSKVGSHTHYYDSNNTCTICGFVRPNKNENGYYEITNADQLFWFADMVNTDNAAYGSANAVLTADIVVNTGNVAGCNGTKTEGWKDWTPIGNITNKYTGTFDGNGNTISGLYFNDSNTSFVGLFGYSCGTIKNVGVVDSYFNGKSFVGGVCGSNGSDLLSGTIENCYNTGKVNGSAMVGGICGQSYNSTIQKCYNTGDVNGTSSNVGGICGANDKTLENCYNTGAVSGTDYVGGLCGEAEWSSLGHSYNIGKISAAEGSIYVGQLYGHMGNGEVGSCYYLADSEIDSDRFGKTADKFASGEVAFLLQGEQEEAVWGQTIGTENYPVFGGVKVYRNETYKGCAGEPGDPTYSYSNTEEKPVYAEHKLYPVNEKAATCTEDGNIKHYKCDVCGKLFADDKAETEVTLKEVTITAAHKLSPVEAKDATCTEDGNIQHYKCDVCGKLFADDKAETEVTLKEVTITAAHKLSLVDEKPATCTEDGNIEHYKCDVCGKLFADKNAEKEVTLEEVTFPKSGHSKDEGIVNKASLTANSITISYNCPVCGEYIGEETVSVTITNVEVTAGKVVVSYTITETGKARTLEYAFDEVTEAIVDIIKSQDIQLIIDFVNSFTAADTDGILTDAQLKAIEYVLAYDFG